MIMGQRIKSGLPCLQRGLSVKGGNDFFQGKVYDYSIEVGSIDAEQMA